MDIYLSYAWNDPAGPDTSDNRDFVDHLSSAISAQGWNLRKDTSEVNYRDSVKNFMQDLGAAKHIIAVVSHKFLQSPYCMYEVKEMLKHRDWQARIYPIVLDDANVFRGNGLEYTLHWKGQLDHHCQQLDAIRGTTAAIPGQKREEELREIFNASGSFVDWLGDACQLKAVEHLSSSFQTVIDSILKTQTPNKNTARTKIIWPEVNFKNLEFIWALRPSATSDLAYQLLVERRSSNLIGPPEQARRRMIDDLLKCGMEEQGIRPLLINMHHYVRSFQGFLDDLCTQTNTEGNKLNEILENAIQASGDCNLLILDNFEAILQEPDSLDARYNIAFMNSLNALRNTPHTRLLLGSTRPHNDGAYQYQGRSSWLDLREFRLPDLELSEIKAEMDALWSKKILPEALRDTLSEHIYTEIHKPFSLLEAVCRQPKDIWDHQPLFQLRELKKKLCHE
jgi:TIR domain